MAHKRPRKAFEADLQAQESPFVTYGTPLPPLDSDARDDGSYVPIWKQEVTDERGRKRLHGAFTGGFSAGYFNTVGSKEGWAPSTFVSSRSNRRKDDPKFAQQRPEDFMDDEDLAEAAEAQSLETSQSFAGLGGTADDPKQKGLLMDLFKIEGDTMGVKLLRRMGWRDGQGIGPKQRRKADLADQDISGITATTHDQHLFAPPDTQMITFTKKHDRKGLGFEGEARLDQQQTESNDRYNAKGNEQDDNDDDDEPMPSSRNGHLESSKRQTPVKRSGLGIGVLNDTGSDEDDPYEMGPKISYNRVIGGDKKKKQQQQQQKPKAKAKPATQTNANPLLGSKPVFRSKKAAPVASSLRKCHDGRLPIDDFVLAEALDASLSIDDEERFPRPRAPEGWVSSKTPAEADVQDQGTYQSTADAAKQSKLDPKSRAAILGEDQLPGKSIFDYLSPVARDRIASATGRTNLPQALNEATQLSNTKPKSPHAQSSAPTSTASPTIPHLAKETALAALGRGTAGWTPYASDPDKASRYRSFLEFRGGLRALPPSRPSDLKLDAWQQELSEFAHAAEVFKPMTGLMASRFTSSATAPRSSTGEAGDEQDQLLRKPSDDEPSAAKDPAEEAARAGMFGPLTRSVRTFYPTRLVCKRFGIRPPEHVVEEQTGASTDNATGSGPSGNSAGRERGQAAPADLVGRAEMERMMRESGRELPTPAPTTSAATDDGSKPFDASSGAGAEAAAIDPERNDALEADRAGEELFKAIFGDDDDDEDE